MLLVASEVFLATAREGHLMRAARILHRTWPAVSAQLRKLEDELKVRLFHRTPKGMVLTEEGTLYRRDAEQAVIWLEDVGALTRGGR